MNAVQGLRVAGAAIAAALALAACGRTELGDLAEADQRCGGRAQSVTVTIAHHGDTEVVRHYYARCDLWGRKVTWSVYPPSFF